MSGILGDSDPCGLHVMSFNIRRRLGLGALRRADRWNRRRPRVRALLGVERPALLATQEAMPDQAAVVLDALGTSYDRVGHGRSAQGTGEGCPMFYDRARLELLDWSQTALSDTPHEAGSRSWGNLIPRVIVHATFRDRGTSSVFRLINTHFDHLSARSRVASAMAVRSAVAADSTPAIVTGDLNAGPYSPAIRELLTGGTLVDVWQTARERSTPEYATHARYRPPRQGLRIDWILTTPDIRAERIGINAEPVHAGWPSDHLPVQAMLLLPDAGGIS